MATNWGGQTTGGTTAMQQYNTGGWGNTAGWGQQYGGNTGAYNTGGYGGNTGTYNTGNYGGGFTNQFATSAAALSAAVAAARVVLRSTDSTAAAIPMESKVQGQTSTTVTPFSKDRIGQPKRLRSNSNKTLVRVMTD
jgi:hypothetical protein